MSNYPENSASKASRSSSVSSASALVVACCSANKRYIPSVLCRDAAQRSEGIAAAWPAMLSAAETVACADELYAGRAFGTVKAAAIRHRCEIGVVSAGLGFVLGRTSVPSYSLTLVNGPDALRRCAPDIQLRNWWSSVCRSRFAADLLQEVSARPVTIIALTQQYAAMMAETLEQLGDDVRRVRLIGLGLRRVVPATAASAILPYDLRAGAALSGGTIGEFAGRAAAFHLDAWSGRDWNLDLEREHAAAVSEAGFVQPAPERRRATDAEIASEIRSVGGRLSASVALRRVRDAGIACGSDRLARIMAAGVDA